jgi:hypothetical protein
MTNSSTEHKWQSKTGPVLKIRKLQAQPPLMSISQHGQLRKWPRNRTTTTETLEWRLKEGNGAQALPPLVRLTGPRLSPGAKVEGTNPRQRLLGGKQHLGHRCSLHQPCRGWPSPENWSPTTCDPIQITRCATTCHPNYCMDSNSKFPYSLNKIILLKRIYT